MRLTWRKEPSLGGLMSIGQGPRGAILKVDGEDVGRVYAKAVSYREYDGWYWTAWKAGVIPTMNTASKTSATLDEAKAACEAYVRKCLAKAAQ